MYYSPLILFAQSMNVSTPMSSSTLNLDKSINYFLPFNLIIFMIYTQYIYMEVILRFLFIRNSIKQSFNKLQVSCNDLFCIYWANKMEHNENIIWCIFFCFHYFMFFQNKCKIMCIYDLLILFVDDRILVGICYVREIGNELNLLLVYIVRKVEYSIRKKNSNNVVAYRKFQLKEYRHYKFLSTQFSILINKV